MTAVSVAGLSKSFGAVTALDNVTLDVPEVGTTALLGPSGCGKTTLLRVIAGFERQDGGTVSLAGAPADGLRPEHRSIGFVAQEGALFPHLTVADNIGFGLSRRERRSTGRIGELLALVQLDTDLLQRFPHQLSGGQQQRVALARALARRPKLVLLDEPFAALDAGLRAHTRALMGQVLRAEGVATVLVTHDQQEALSFADQLVMMHAGVIRQTGAPQQVYAHPVDEWTAAFLGDAILLPGTADRSTVDCVLGRLPTADAGTGRVTVLIRPEQLSIDERHDPGAVTATVTDCRYYGHDSVVSALLPGGEPVTIRMAGSPRVHQGEQIALTVSGPAITYPSRRPCG